MNLLAMILRETDINTYRYTYVHRGTHYTLNLLSCLLIPFAQAISNLPPIFLLPIPHLNIYFSFYLICQPGNSSYI